MNMKNKYYITIILAAATLVFLYNSQTKVETPKNKPVFFERMPTGFQKVKQHINIDIDYEKLPARNEIRLIGRVNAAHIKADVIEYKWALKDNLKHKKGSLSGQLKLSDSTEITLDVAIKDMNKKVNVRLEAYAQGKTVKIGSVQSFTYDPTNETAESMEALNKATTENLSKQEIIEKALSAPRKPSLQQ